MKDLIRRLPHFFRKNKLLVITLSGVFILAFIIRILFLPINALSFAYDQARDAFVVRDLLGGDFKLLGPPVSGIPGLYHGVLYYYVLTLGYLIGNMSPIGAAYFMSFISSLTVFTVFVLTYKLSGKYLPSLISSLIFAFSFEASQYSNLLTNASMGVWFVPLIYLFLYLWLKKPSLKYAALTGLFLGLAIQSEIALAYHIVPVAVWLIIKRKMLRKAEVILFLFSLSIALLSMILSEIRFGFKGISGAIYLFTGKDEIAGNMQPGRFILIYLDQISKTLSYTLFPLNILFGGFLAIGAILFSLGEFFKHKNRDILSWQTFLPSYILCHIVALPFGGSNMRHIMVGAVGGISVFYGIFIWKYLGKFKTAMYVILFTIIISNLIMILKENYQGQTIFPLQRDLVLSKEISLVDYTYKESSNENKFSINTLTSPLYVNTLWSYLYNWYGVKKYGYLPFWTGKDQIDLPGDNLKFAGGDTRLHYFIIEPTYGIPREYVGYAFGEEDSRSKLVDQREFGELKVQKRLMNK